MKETVIILSCTWKFAATFPVAIYAMKMSAAETLICTNAGGILGLFIFLNFSGYLLRVWDKFSPAFNRKKRKVFTSASRRLVRIKNKFGLAGIAILSPSILSIPVGAFLAAKYYGLRMRVWIFLAAGQVFWSLVFTFFYTQIRIAAG